MEQGRRPGPRLRPDSPRREHTTVVIAYAEYPRIRNAFGAALHADLDAERLAALDRARHIPYDDASRVRCRALVTFSVHVTTLRFSRRRRDPAGFTSPRRTATPSPAP